MSQTWKFGSIMRLKRLFRMDWLLAADSQKLARLYLITLGLFAISGLIAAMVLQFELTSSRAGLVSAHRFGQLMTHHGLTMVFVVLLPLIPAVLGSLIVPGAVGAAAPAMPRLSRAAWVMHTLGGIGVIAAVEGGAYDSGWTMLMPAARSPLNLVLIAGLLLVVAATFLIHWSIAVTIVSKRHRTIPSASIPVMAWFFLLGSLVVIIVSPIRAFALTAQALHHFGLTSLLSVASPSGIVLHQHLFWAYAGPAMYAAVLPAIGVTLGVLAARCGAAVLLRRAVIIAGIALAQLSLVSWGQHLLTAADSQRLALMGSLFGMLTAVPLAVILFSWLRMLLRARPQTALPVLIAWLQFGLIVIGGLAAVALAAPSTGAVHQSSYFATGQMHLIAVGVILPAFLIGMSHRFPLPEGRPTTVGRWVVGALAGGVLLAYVPMLINGLAGSPKALYAYPERFTAMHAVSTAGTVILAFALIGIIGLIGRSVVRGTSRRREPVRVQRSESPA